MSQTREGRDVATGEDSEGTRLRNRSHLGPRIAGDRALAHLLPTLITPVSREFNLFEVLHHGTNEKQVSNLFTWLLKSTESHELGDQFARWFIDEVNAGLEDSGVEPVQFQRFLVSQEENTLETRLGGDIADIVMRGDDVVLVIENFHVSDGHGHDYQGYLKYGASLGGRPVAVMLCGAEDRSRLTRGWEQAPVVLYENLVRRLADFLNSNPDFGTAHPEQAWFFSQMAAHFVKGQRMSDAAILEFLNAMCQTGEVKRYGSANAAQSFGEFVREQAELRFGEGQALLNQTKVTLHRYLQSSIPRLNDSLGDEFFDGADIRFQGVNQWTVSLRSHGERVLFVTFGPSAWTDNEIDVYKSWDTRVDSPDYRHLFIGYKGTRTMRQSKATMDDVLHRPLDDTSLLEDIKNAVKAT